jgi:Pyruvate/2-oxoacid:ferredoxin oxidoreductase gamma subunit
VNPDTKARSAFYLTAQEYPFCPGCGHGLILNALGHALGKLQLRPEQVAVVTDIGCVGLSDAHLKVHTFHGLHGRSVAYAGGLKLARPDLHVIVLMGDGGTGIGAGHILAAARRNSGITVLVFNNFNFGMTGGEHSVTTFSGACTVTTPVGNPEVPFDLAGTVALNGASFVARKPSTDLDLFDVIAQAIATPGFALMDIWELCTAYFVPANQFTGKLFNDYAARAGLQMGIIKEAQRPTFEAHAQQLIAQSEPPQPPRGLTVRFPGAARDGVTQGLTRRTGLLVAGSAGGKVRSTVGLIAQAAMMSGLHVNQKDDYPVTIKTGHSVSTLVLDPQPMRFGMVTAPDMVVILTPEGLHHIRAQLAKLPAGTRIYADASLNLPATNAAVTLLDSAGLRRAVGKENIALALSAKALIESGALQVEALKAAIELTINPAYQDKALAAVRLGCEL